MVKTTKSNNYLFNTLGISEWNILQLTRLGTNQGDTESRKLNKSSNIKLITIDGDSGETMTTQCLSDRRTKYGDCG